MLFILVAPNQVIFQMFLKLYLKNFVKQQLVFSSNYMSHQIYLCRVNTLIHKTGIGEMEK